MLEAEGVHVVVPVPCMPADIFGIEVLRNVTIRRPQRVVPREVTRLFDELNGVVIGLLSVVDDDPRQRRRGGGGWRGGARRRDFRT